MCPLMSKGFYFVKWISGRGNTESVVIAAGHSSLTQDFAQFGVRLVLLITWSFSRPNFSVLFEC